MKFCDEYMIDMNGAAAYLRAGYNCSEETARANASRLLANANIKEEISKRQQKVQETTEFNAEWVLNELADNHRMAKQMGDINPSNKALELIGKHIGMFTEKVKMDVSGQVNHEHEYFIEQQITADPETIGLLKQLWKRQAGTT